MAYDDYGRWPKYVPVAQRHAKADKEMQKRNEKGWNVEPVTTEGRKIAHTFWGKAWCDHLEKFSDYDNRLPRGRTYVRNGSVRHLAILEGSIEAIVSGSEPYTINIDIAPLSAKKWKKVQSQCTGQIGSMLELLQGRFSDNVMSIVTDPENGLFPQPHEIKLDCDCPDWADMCKHIAAVLYGVGTRLDHQPELLFLLRNVDQEDLITAELDVAPATSGKGKRRLATTDLSNLFDIEMDEPIKPPRKKRTMKKKAAAKKKTVAKKKITTKKKSIKKAVKKKSTLKKKRPFTPTAAAIRRLRKQFEMNSAQFAVLVGVSPPTVSHWENGSGKLKLRQRTLEALTQVAGLTLQQAWRKWNKS